MVDNLHDYSTPVPAAELTEVLLEQGAVRIERIVSRGSASPPDFWYDQSEGEWIVLLSGAARVRFEADGRVVSLVPGDFVEIPAHSRHRVDWTEPDVDTVWLAVFWKV